MKLLAHQILADTYIKQAMKRKSIVVQIERITVSWVRRVDKEDPFEVYANDDCIGQLRDPISIKEVERWVLGRNVDWDPAFPNIKLGEEFVVYDIDRSTNKPFLYKMTVFLHFEDLLAPNKSTRKKR